MLSLFSFLFQMTQSFLAPYVCTNILSFSFFFLFSFLFLFCRLSSPLSRHVCVHAYILSFLFSFYFLFLFLQVIQSFVAAYVSRHRPRRRRRLARRAERPPSANCTTVQPRQDTRGSGALLAASVHAQKDSRPTRRGKGKLTSTKDCFVTGSGSFRSSHTCSPSAARAAAAAAAVSGGWGRIGMARPGGGRWCAVCPCLYLTHSF